MSKPRGGLGRGLAALIPTGPQTNIVSDVFMGGSSNRIDTMEGSSAEPDDKNQKTETDAPERTTSESTTSRNTTSEEAVSAQPIPVHGVVPADNPEATAYRSDDVSNGSASTGDAVDDTASSDRAATGRYPSSAAAGSAEVDAPLTDGPRYEEVPIELIRPNPRNPRTVFDEDALSELEHSLREFGLLQPIVVRQVADGYELVMGERRWRAAQRAGLTTISAIIRKTEDADLLRDALLENIHRANLNPLEEAAAYQQLLQEFGVTQEELATRIGRSRPVISNTIRLLRLPVAVQRRVAAGVLSAGHARALLSLETADQQEELATRVVAEGLSVRGTEEAVMLMAGRTAKPKRAAPRKLVMPSLAKLATTLSDTFDTRVRVELGKQKGRVIVEFATVDDLERIVAIMAPEALSQHRNATASNE